MKKEMTINPWEVKGDINYEKLVKEFGVSPLKELPDVFNKEILFRRKFVFAHRDIQRILEAIKNKKKFVMMTGLMPTGKFHFGHMIIAMQMIFYQKLGAKVYIAVADLEAYNARGQTLEESRKIAINEYIPNYIALGLDIKKCDVYFQSERRGIYLEHIQRMYDAGTAYRCYCTKEELDEKRSKALTEGKKPKYDGTCRDIIHQADEKPYVIRFRAPDSGVTVVDDMIKGRVEFDNSELDDLVIARTDGSPTYNFVVVIDDAVMGITHIIRGDDHLNNTPRQILLYEAMGYTLPRFGHVPLILGTDKKRLSKRHGATSVNEYKMRGILPQALLNHLALLGWSSPKDQEILSVQDLVEQFSLDRINSASAIFDEQKLLWINSMHLRKLNHINHLSLL